MLKNTPKLLLILLFSAQLFAQKNIDPTADDLKKLIRQQKISVLINQEGYSRKFTKLVLKSKRPDTSVINNLHINPLNFYDNYKQFIGLFLNAKYGCKYRLDKYVMAVCVILIFLSKFISCK